MPSGEGKSDTRTSGNSHLSGKRKPRPRRSAVCSAGIDVPSAAGQRRRSGSLPASRSETEHGQGHPEDEPGAPVQVERDEGVARREQHQHRGGRERRSLDLVAGEVVGIPVDLAAAGDTVSLPDFSIPGMDRKLSIVTGADRTRTVNRALQALGGIERFIKSGDRVVLKVNAAFASAPALSQAERSPFS